MILGKQQTKLWVEFQSLELAFGHLLLRRGQVLVHLGSLVFYVLAPTSLSFQMVSHVFL